jgi:hypothetical protein
MAGGNAGMGRSGLRRLCWNEGKKERSRVWAADGVIRVLISRSSLVTVGCKWMDEIDRSLLG